VYLYSALFVVPHTQGAQAWITQCYLQLHQCLPLPRKFTRWRLPRLRLRISNCSLLLIYLPERMKGCILLWYSCFISLSSNFMLAFPYCRLSAYIVLKSGKLQPIPSPYQSRYTCTAEGPTTFMKFWTRSDKWRQNGGLGHVPDVGFFCKQYHTTFRQQADFRQIWQRHVNRQYTSLILPSLILGLNCLG